MRTGMKILTLMLMVGMSAQAQEESSDAKGKRLVGGFGYFNSTGQKLEMGGLNTMLNKLGYSSVNENYLSMGGGGMFVINNFLLGGEGGGFIGSTSGNATSSVEFNAGCGYFNLGYIVHSTHRSVLYPIVGAGIGGYSLDIKLKNVNPNFQDLLNAPSGGVTIESGGVLLNAQLAYQYFLHKHGKQGFFIGVKAGYRYCPGTWNMKANGNELSNAPTVNMNGAFVSIILGGGALINNK